MSTFRALMAEPSGDGYVTLFKDLSEDVLPPGDLLIEVVRSPLLGKGPADPLAYAVAGGMTLLVFAAAALTLNRLERKVIFQL